jgi:hypothetical protein
MTSDEFDRLVDDSQGDYCLNPILYTEAMQSNEQKQASPKENKTCKLVNRPVNAKLIPNRWAARVKKSCDNNACFKAQLLVNGAVSWTSQLQKTTALLTTEAETTAASDGAKEPGGSACCQNVFDLKHCVVKLELPPGSNEVTYAMFVQCL